MNMDLIWIRNCIQYSGCIAPQCNVGYKHIQLSCLQEADCNGRYSVTRQFSAS